ncbi:MAG: phage minor head protein [Pseudomonadota bacterium]|nr:phage minor head protein [Pseudomonadota bacterium]
MAAFDLPALARREGIRRDVTLRPIEPTQAHAQEIARLYLAVVRAWQESIGAIMGGYTVPTLDGARFTIGDSTKEITSEASISAGLSHDSRSEEITLSDAPADQQAVIDRTAEEVSRLIVAFGVGIERLAVRIEQWHRAKWIVGVKAGTKVDLSTVLTAQPMRETLEAWLARNVALVTDISDQAKGRISDAVFRAYQNRTPTRELARELREAVGMARSRAIRVAADQNTKLSGALDAERMAEAGVELWKWRHSGKRHPREDHRARDGRVYRLGSNKRVNADGTAMKGGETIASGDAPSEPPWCGCRRQAYLAIMGG